METNESESLNAVLQPVLRHRVCVVMKKDNRYSEAIIGTAVIAAGRRDWTLAEWNDLLKSLDSCKDSVEDYLSVNA